MNGKIKGLLNGILGKRKSNDISKSWAIRTLNCSPMRETMSNDPRGYSVAYKEAEEKIMAPVYEYLKKHPKEKLTAELIDRINFKSEQ